MAIPETPANQMTFWEHLQELRVRLTRSLFIVAAGFGITYYFRLKIWEFAQAPFLAILARQLNKPVAELQPFAYTSLTEPFFSLMRLSLWAAAFLVAPFLFHQLWAFIRPGLLPRERRFAVPFVLFTSLCFLGGAWFAYRYAFTILAGILSEEAQAAFLRPNLHVNDYLDLFIYTIVGTGLMFELPVMFFLLAKLRVVTARGMLRYWRHAVIGIVVAAALLTPGDVIVTTIFFSVVLLALYFVSVLVAWAGQPKAVPEAALPRPAPGPRPAPPEPETPVAADPSDEPED